MVELPGDAHPRRLSGWKILGIVAGFLAVLVGSFWFWVDSVADRRWEAMERKVRELHAEVRARDGARPPIRGAGVPGNAWDDYGPAVKAAKAIGPDAVLGEFISRGSKADRAKVESVLATHGGLLDGLRNGALRTHTDFGYKWERGVAVEVPGLLQSQRLANLAVSQARILAEDGRHREAAELLLETAQFGRDVGSDGVLITEMIGIAVLGLALDELRDVVLSGKLSREELIQVDAELATLDGSFPRNGRALLNDTLGMGISFLQPEASLQDFGAGASEVLGSLLAGWRYGFSGRIMTADAFEFMLHHSRRCVAVEDKDWTEVRRVADETAAEVARSKNEIVRIAMPGLLQTERVVRERRAQLRLLRAASHALATGNVPDIEDPFGAKLLSAKSGNTLKIWSVGRDGADDVGSGAWKPANSKDIVIELKP